MPHTLTHRIQPHFATAAKLLLLLLVVAGVILIARHVRGEETVAWLTARVEALGIWGPLAFAGLFVLLTVLLLPATPVTVACGAVFGTIEGAAIISGASVVSATLSFLLSRYFAHEQVAARVHHYPKLEALYRALGGAEGWKLVVAVRLSHAMPFGLQNLLFGISPIRFVPFVAATLLAMLPGTLLYVYLGHLGAIALQEETSAPSSSAFAWWARLAGLLVAILAVLYVTKLGRRIIREKAHVDLTTGALSQEPIPEDQQAPALRNTQSLCRERGENQG